MKKHWSHQVLKICASLFFLNDTDIHPDTEIRASYFFLNDTDIYSDTDIINTNLPTKQINIINTKEVSVYSLPPYPNLPPNYPPSLNLFWNCFGTLNGLLRNGFYFLSANFSILNLESKLLKKLESIFPIYLKVYVNLYVKIDIKIDETGSCYKYEWL